MGEQFGGLVFGSPSSCCPMHRHELGTLCCA